MSNNDSISKHHCSYKVSNNEIATFFDILRSTLHPVVLDFNNAKELYSNIDSCIDV